MIVITWNVQWCRGVDGEVAPARIGRTARELADFDVLCLQEVAINFPGLAGSRGEDQMAELSAALPGYVPLFGVATDLDDGKGGRRRFGNAIFSRLPVLQVFRHLLSWPADPSSTSMQRMALEAVVVSPAGPLRVISTHLEYYSAPQRAAQVEDLLRLHAEACAHARAPRPDSEPGGPFEAVARPLSAILCGDFNFKPQDPEHGRMIARLTSGAPGLVDAWHVAHPDVPHPPTIGVHEKSLPPYCCDFVFVTADLAASVEDVTVNADTQASDHQPVVLRLADRIGRIELA
jgi:endonuclease/exonuclease/phosphatase family metal-dependent hydrolase